MYIQLPVFTIFISGNLVFAHVMTDDHIDNWLYRCVAENAIAGLSAFGSYAQLNVKPSKYFQQSNNYGVLMKKITVEINIAVFLESKEYFGYDNQ